MILSNFDEQDSIEKTSIEENIGEKTIIKKVAVSWNKFIKMKSKRFTDDYDVL